MHVVADDHDVPLSINGKLTGRPACQHQALVSLHTRHVNPLQAPEQASSRGGVASRLPTRWRCRFWGWVLFCLVLFWGRFTPTPALLRLCAVERWGEFAGAAASLGIHLVKWEDISPLLILLRWPGQIQAITSAPHLTPPPAHRPDSQPPVFQFLSVAFCSE